MTDGANIVNQTNAFAKMSEAQNVENQIGRFRKKMIAWQNIVKSDNPNFATKRYALSRGWPFVSVFIHKTSRGGGGPKTVTVFSPPS